jgi:hypothetical protein
LPCGWKGDSSGNFLWWDRTAFPWSRHASRTTATSGVKVAQHQKGLTLTMAPRRGRMMAGHLLLSLPVTNGNNGQNLSVRVRQPKAVGFSPGVALEYIRGAGLRGRDGLIFGTQDTGLFLDRNGSLQPID